MTPKQFDLLVDTTLAHCRELLNSKGANYAPGDDRFHNFRVASNITTEERAFTPAMACLGMWRKQLVSLIDMIETRPSYLSQVRLNEVIDDLINYMLLTKGMLYESYDLHLMPTTAPADTEQVDP